MGSRCIINGMFLTLSDLGAPLSGVGVCSQHRRQACCRRRAGIEVKGECFGVFFLAWQN